MSTLYGLWFPFCSFGSFENGLLKSMSVKVLNALEFQSNALIVWEKIQLAVSQVKNEKM